MGGHTGPLRVLDFPVFPGPLLSSRHIVNACKRRDFVCLWSGSLGASFAMNMQIIARGWLVYTMTSSAMDLAWVTLSFMVPQVLFSLWGGVLADRFHKRRIVVSAQMLNCVATVFMATIIITERVTFWDFIWLGMFNGTVLAFSIPARHAFVPELVPRRLIFTAMALHTTGMNFARILGPAIAGFLIAWVASGDTSSQLGVGVVYYVIAVLYFVASVTMMFVEKPGAPHPRESTSPLQDMLEGLAYVRANPPVFGLIMLSVAAFLFGMPLNTLLPAFNQDILGGGSDDLGLLMSCMGLGAIAGSLMLASAGELKRKHRWMIGTCFGWAASTAALALATDLPVAMLVVAVFGWMSAWNLALNRGLIQTQVEMRMRGRVMSIDMMSHGLMPLGMIPIGWIADTFGVASALAVSGVLFAAVVAALKWLSPAVRRVGRPVVAVGATR